MVNFKKLVKEAKKVDVKNHLALFDSLDRQTSHTELRPAQIQSLKALGERRKDKDVVLKLSTGAGKTGVALLYLQSYMEESGKPVVYLCPTVQLAKQVMSEAAKLGIKAELYPANEPHPPVEGTAGKAIIVCTYDKLFNAKTTFDRTDVMLRPYAIVLDDAHAGVEEIRDSFTLRITDKELKKKLISLLNPACEDHNPAIWQAVLNKDPVAFIEVPYWIWKPLVDEIMKLFTTYASRNDFIFVWPYLREVLRWCRCIISGAGIEIVPDVLPVHKVAAYVGTEHRLFMSATLADDAVLVRELDCDSNAARSPILPKNDRGLGERMVLAPALVDKKLDREWVMKLCKSLSKKVSVVILSSSEVLAREWESYGAKVVLKEEVTKAVDALKAQNKDMRFVVFVQRYDGIDLPDNACRILVIDGMPYGQGVVDQYDSQKAALAGGIRNRLIYRIEQGMGRAVRSHADYAVIILAGPELANFIAKHEVLQEMNPDTKAQLQLALDLARLARESGEDNPGKTLSDMIAQSLNRDEGWKQYYDENVRKMEKPQALASGEIRINMAEVERRAFDAAISNNPSEAASIIQDGIYNYSLSEKEKGWYLQKKGNYIYEVNPGEGLEIQRASYEKNNLLFCPPAVVRRPPSIGKVDAQAIIVKWFKEFANPNGAIAAIADLRAKLSYDVSPETLEKAIFELAVLLGAIGSRPEKEYGEGPDDLWLWPEISVVIEVKNESKETLHKKDAGQLLLSLQWFNKNYPARDKGIPMIVAKVTEADRKSGFPDEVRVLTPKKMNILLDRLEGFFQAIIKDPTILTQPNRLVELKSKNRIMPEQFIGEYTEKLKERK